MNGSLDFIQLDHGDGTKSLVRLEHIIYFKSELPELGKGCWVFFKGGEALLVKQSYDEIYNTMARIWRNV